MSEMVERVVAVLIEETRGFSCGSMDYEGAVRKLMAAMREPTDAMLEEALGTSFKGEVWPDDFLVLWKVMIDAALQEDKG